MQLLQERPQGRFDVSLCDVDSTVGRFDNVVATVVRGDSVPEAIEASYVLCNAIRDEGRRIAVLTVTTPNARMPSPAAREAIARLNKEFVNDYCASATVFLGDGLLRSGLRAVARAMTLSMSGKFPREVYGDTQSACEFVGAAAGTDTRGLAEALERCAHRGDTCCM